MKYNKHYPTFFIMLLSAFLSSGIVYAGQHNEHGHNKNKAENIAIEHGRVNPTVPGMKVTGVYFNIKNNTAKDITLINALSSTTDRTEIHHHINVDGLSKMQKVSEGVVIPAGKTIEFAPGGLHIMIMGLTKAIHEGEEVVVELQFDDGSHIDVFAKATRPSAGHTPTHKHHHH